MATLPMKKMNKLQKRKLKRLEARLTQYENFCKSIRGYAEANRRKPGAVK